MSALPTPTPHRPRLHKNEVSSADAALDLPVEPSLDVVIDAENRPDVVARVRQWLRGMLEPQTLTEGEQQTVQSLLDSRLNPLELEPQDFAVIGLVQEWGASFPETMGFERIHQALAQKLSLV